MINKDNAIYEILKGTKKLTEGREHLFPPDTTEEELSILDDALDDAIALEYVELVQAPPSGMPGVFYLEPRITKRGLEQLELMQILQQNAN